MNLLQSWPVDPPLIPWWSVQTTMISPGSAFSGAKCRLRDDQLAHVNFAKGAPKKSAKLCQTMLKQQKHGRYGSPKGSTTIRMQRDARNTTSEFVVISSYVILWYVPRSSKSRRSPHEHTAMVPWSSSKWHLHTRQVKKTSRGFGTQALRMLVLDVFAGHGRHMSSSFQTAHWISVGSLDHFFILFP